MNNRSFLRGAIIVLSVITAIIHFTRPGIPFLLNAVGFLVLAAAVVFEPAFLAGRQRLVQYALMALAIVTILAWVAIGDKSLPDGLTGYIAKVDELLLLAAVFQYGRLPKTA